MIGRLQRVAAPYVEEEPIAMAIGDDQKLAAEFFRAQGIKIKGSD